MGGRVSDHALGLRLNKQAVHGDTRAHNTLTPTQWR